MKIARMMAGIPTLNAGLYRKIRFLVGDPVAWVEFYAEEGGVGVPATESTLILRDIEMQRARASANATHIACPADFTPTGGLSGDRETATAQSAAEFVIRNGFSKVTVDRSLPMIYAEMLNRAGIAVHCDTEWGLIERRQKDASEIAAIRFAQQQTEEVMRLACQTIARAGVDQENVLMHEGRVLTSERMQSMIDVWLLERGFSNPMSIVASGPVGADCHDHGHGPIRTMEPVIVDIFPRDKKSLYNGDCTRTVVHGKISPTIASMHAAVTKAKAAAMASVRAGVTGQSVHEATSRSIEASGYQMGFPPEGAHDDFASMTHGTGHGLGLEVHEPPLLALGGPELLEGDVVTIEPGLYCKSVGGVRLEDMVVVTSDGCINLNSLPEGLDWS
ncbi:MAG: M24 family metallopeptidase [Planctomycetota bacterium]|jgi:Xaa-Pro aminopeptidase|nr:M24 family metallopeptidase [Planctomycetota bacterium]